jgi:hypothetical protein
VGHTAVFLFARQIVATTALALPQASALVSEVKRALIVKQTVVVEDMALVIPMTPLASVMMDSTSTLHPKNVNSSVLDSLAYNATVPICLSVLGVKVVPAIMALVSAGQAIVV